MTNNIPLLKIDKKTHGKIEQAKVLISVYCTLYNIKLSDTQSTILAYFMVYKINESTKELIIKAQLATKDSIKNVMTLFRKNNLMKVVNKKDFLNESLDMDMQPIMSVIIRVDNR